MIVFRVRLAKRCPICGLSPFCNHMHDMCKGPKVEWVKEDFGDRLREKGLWPSGSGMFDLWRWKGRAPSSQAQFCTEHLKLRPIRDWLESIRSYHEVEMLVGIRAGESEKRSKMPEEEESDFYKDCTVRRPLLRWTEEQVFAFLKEKGVEPNPLYQHGSNRVGCYPCIHSRKRELANMPDWTWEKLAVWEKLAGRTWFSFGTIPLTQTQQEELATIPLTEQLKEPKSPSLGTQMKPEPIAFAKFKDKHSPSIE